MSTESKSLTGILGLVVVAGVAWGTCMGCRQSPPPDKAPGPASQVERAGETTMELTVHSRAFEAGRVIPRKHTGEGEDVSPQLSWSGVPEGAKELALIMDDPDAPRPEPWVHWVICKIPPTVTELKEGIPASEKLTDPAGAIQGRNSWPAIGYRGPMPPPGHGTHHYHFKLYALDTALSVLPGLTKEELLAAMRGHILAEGELVGTYERKR